MKKLKKIIIRYIKESLDSLFVDQIVSMAFGVFVTWLVENNIDIIDDQSVSIGTKLLVLGSIFLIVYCFSTLMQLRPNRYKFRMKSIEIILEYQGDDINVYSTYKFSTNRLRANRMYTRRTWFSDEKFKLLSKTEGYAIEKIGRLGDTHEYNICFPKYQYIGQTKTFKCEFSGSNKKRRFENFYWYDVICPTDELIIEVRVPRVYSSNKAQLKSFLTHENSDNSNVTDVEFDGVYRWEIPNPKLGWSYKFEWGWSKKELSLIKKRKKSNH